MEIKEVWFDLEKVERKWKTTFHIESEKFDKPISLKVWYEDNELDKFNNAVSELKVELNNKDSKIYELESKLDASNRVIKDIQDELKEQKKINQILDGALVKQSDEIKSLYKVIADLKTTVETLSGTILQLQGWMKLIDKKITKQPMVFSDKTFISGHESCGLSVIEIPSGEYLVISKYVVGEHNEFVTNENDVVFEKVNVSDNSYIPYYKLDGWTQLDTPTATIYRDLVFIPC